LKNSNDDINLIKRFIDNQNTAIKNDIDGKVFYDYHYEIKRIMGSAMKDYTDNDKVYTFYHTLNLCELYAINKKNYIYYQEAFALLIPRILTKECRCSIGTFNSTVAFVLFNVIDEKIENEQKFEDIPYADFHLMSQFIKKCASYGDYFSMYDKRKQFLKYLDNDLLIEQLEKNLPAYFESERFSFDNTLAGILILLLVSDGKKEKEILKSINKCNFYGESIDWLRKFYEFFQDTDANKKLLKELNKSC
jgi:hypothetical protein